MDGRDRVAAKEGEWEMGRAGERESKVTQRSKERDEMNREIGGKLHGERERERGGRGRGGE